MLSPTKPLSISWSQLRAHAECRQKSFLLRAGKKSPAGNIRNFFHGMVVDRAMRDFLADPAHPLGSMVARVDELIDAGEQQAITEGDGVVRWRSASDRADLRMFCVTLLTRLEPLLVDLILPHTFSCALRFKTPITIPYLDGTPTMINLVGEMDLLVDEGASWVVWDLKATPDNNYWRKVAGQLIFYDLAVLGLHGVPTDRVGLIQPMCTSPVIQFTVGPQSRQQMWAAVISLATDIWRNEKSCKEGTAGCAYCEVRHACVRFSSTANQSVFGELADVPYQPEVAA